MWGSLRLAPITVEMQDIIGMSLSRHRLQALLHGTGLVKTSDTTIL